MVLVFLVLQKPIGRAKDTSLQQVTSWSIYSGNQDHRARVRVVLSKSVSNSMVAYRAISNGVPYTHIGATAFNTSFIEVCAPTQEATDEEVEKFYDSIRIALEISQSQDIVFVAGGFNAKVDADCCYPEVWGRHGLGMQNDGENDCYIFARITIYS